MLLRWRRQARQITQSDAGAHVARGTRPGKWAAAETRGRRIDGGDPVHAKDEDLPDGSAVFKPIAEGDLTPGYTVHQLINGRADAWLRCYQVELK